MAKQCCVCGKKLTFLEGGTPIHRNHSDYEWCLSCQQKFRDVEYTTKIDEFDQLYLHFSSLISSPTLPDDIKNIFSGIENRRNHLLEKQEKEKDYKSRFAEMLLTTCEILDGYRVIKYFGLVSTDILYHSGVKERIDAWAGADTPLEAALGISGHELAEITILLDDAKEYAFEKIKKEATDLGANCILGLDVNVDFIMPARSERSVSTEWAKVSVKGTAVKIEKN